MNWLDALLILLILTGVGIGFLQGLIRQVLNFLSLYVALAMASYFHLGLGDWLQFLAGNISPEVKVVFSFLTLLTFGYIVLIALSQRAFPETSLEGLRMMDQLGGLILGFFLISLQIGVALRIFEILGSAFWFQAEGLRLAIQRAMTTSALVPFFRAYLLVIAQTLIPLLPAGLPRFFDFVSR